MMLINFVLVMGRGVEGVVAVMVLTQYMITTANHLRNNC